MDSPAICVPLKSALLSHVVTSAFACGGKTNFDTIRVGKKIFSIQVTKIGNMYYCRHDIASHAAILGGIRKGLSTLTRLHQIIPDENIDFIEDFLRIYEIMNEIICDLHIYVIRGDSGYNIIEGDSTTMVDETILNKLEYSVAHKLVISSTFSSRIRQPDRKIIISGGETSIKVDYQQFILKCDSTVLVNDSVYINYASPQILHAVKELIEKNRVISTPSVITDDLMYACQQLGLGLNLIKH